MPRRRKRAAHTSAGVILVDANGRILLQLRDDDPNILYPNHWGITGGDAGKGETPEETARREVREETGLEIECLLPFKVYDEEDGGARSVTHFYYSRTNGSTDMMVVGEGQALEFFAPEELEGLRLAYCHADVLADFVASREYRSCLEDGALAYFREALESGADWFSALLEAIARWETPEEEVAGRHYRYLIGGEAFDWLLLAERLCEAVDGAIPADEKEALLFFGRMPRELGPDEFKRAIGDAKHRAHLNFLYGVRVEEALQLVVEEEVLKEQRARVWDKDGTAEQRVFERIYGLGWDGMLKAFQEKHGLPLAPELSYGELMEFTYWLFKFRVNQGDPARVGSDTRKALAKISELEAAVGRRAQFLASPVARNGVEFVEGEVVAHVH